MDDLQFNILFNSILVISGQRVGDNGKLCATELRLRLNDVTLLLLCCCFTSTVNI